MRRGRRAGMFLLAALALALLVLSAAVFFPDTQAGIPTGGVSAREGTAAPKPTTTPRPAAAPEPGKEVLEATATPEPTAVPEPPTEAKVLDVPFIDQRKRWPTGCESVSTVMALQYWGEDVEVDEFIEDCLPRGNAPYWKDNVLWACDPWKAFPGDPHSKNGWGCFPPVIVAALEEYLDQRPELSLSVTSLEGWSLDDLCATYIDEGVPVILWATIEMEEPRPGLTFYLEDTGEAYTWTDPLHCLLLVGWDETSYYFNDPLAAKGTAYSREATQRAYEGLGSLAVVVAPEN